MQDVTSPFPEAAGNNIRVAVRCRPPNKRELALQEKQDKAGVSAAGPQRIPALVVGVPGAEPPVGRIDVWGTPTPFQYDIAFPMNANQLDVFEHVGVDIVKCAYHGCEFSCDRSFLSQITDHSPN